MSLLVVMHLAFVLYNSLHFGDFCVVICVSEGVREEKARKATSKYKVGGEIGRDGKERGRASA